jgi:carbon-monoxide dehydrogenase small subunit
MSLETRLILNGADHRIPAAWSGRRLLDYLREVLRLTGTKEGCGEGDCGACTVLVDDEPLCACLVLCGMIGGRRVVTVEGLSREHLEAFARACASHGAVQCGFCTSGMAVMGAWMSKGGREAGVDEPDKLLEGNICRCGAYAQLARVMEDLT